MVTLGVDAHKRTHTIVAVDERGRQLAAKTIGTNTKDHLGLLTWAEQVAVTAGEGGGLLWAVEDCRHLSRRLERDLLAAGQSIVRVSPKLMAHARDSARTYGKSDPIDALAVARAAQREPGLPVARLDGPDRDVRLLTDHRESLSRRADPGDLPAALAPSRSWIPPGNRRPGPWTGSLPWTRSTPASRAWRGRSPAWRGCSLPAAAN